ncbi:D-beta-hydroxybutyrate dehydrogenase, mitochondrial [Plakobranchus ocellatus]|uniref:D-beta-hydroxybutyrate dehydrogenase, mitochondrial n=1 Tax=Plakobranchus ocellatus TaxID=259542 RepID=A0AAV4BT65_9GAST|nr:D-beta-hydroxybutyrate dehydrogenase, mitochondrial [Plakobranchus ocellatus]
MWNCVKARQHPLSCLDLQPLTGTMATTEVLNAAKSLSRGKQRFLLSTAVYVVVALVLYVYAYALAAVILILMLAWYGIDLIRQHTAEKIDPSGKYVFITGCDSGFGLESAKAIRDLGFQVIAGCYNDNSPGAKELRDRPWVKKVEVVSLDVTSEASVQACAEEVKAICNDQGLWAVINNAGINIIGPVELVTMEMFHRCAEVNLFGPLRVTKSVLPLIRQTQGRIVNVSSERAFNPRAQSAPYCISKAGLEIFSSCLQREMEEFKVKVITIAPGEFAGATAIVTTEATDYLRERLLRSQAQLSLSDQEAELYSRDNITNIIQSFERAMEKSGASAEPVIQAYIDAVLNADPLRCYLIHGFKRQCMDPFIVSH